MRVPGRACETAVARLHRLPGGPDLRRPPPQWWCFSPTALCACGRQRDGRSAPATEAERDVSRRLEKEYHQLADRGRAGLLLSCSALPRSRARRVARAGRMRDSTCPSAYPFVACAGWQRGLTFVSGGTLCACVCGSSLCPAPSYSRELLIEFHRSHRKLSFHTRMLHIKPAPCAHPTGDGWWQAAAAQIPATLFCSRRLAPRRPAASLPHHSWSRRTAAQHCVLVACAMVMMCVHVCIGRAQTSALDHCALRHSARCTGRRVPFVAAIARVDTRARASGRPVRVSGQAVERAGSPAHRWLAAAHFCIGRSSEEPLAH